MAFAVGVSSNSASIFSAPKSKRMRAMRLLFAIIALAGAHFHDRCKPWQEANRSDAEPRPSFLFRGTGFPASRKNCACGCYKTNTDETNGMKMSAGEQKPADARSDCLSDVKQRRIERD